MTKIEINRLTKKIKANDILSDINLTMTSGHIYGFQGINGSGKTMLMRCIIGLLRPTDGYVSVNEKKIGIDQEFPESIGFLLENPSFLNRYTGFENLKMLASIKGRCSDDDIRHTMQRVGLTDVILEKKGEKKYKKYSLGMKQRLGIAAAIMERPDIIILDEPTNSLDEDGVLMTKQIILEERSRGALVILSCHDAAWLEEVCDEMFLIRQGRIVTAP